uniref:Uncharacterized protein n=1 Tax=viral metagenome TaxID=1070528 RepID=A0A6C0JEM0_9ZZZZ
MPTLFDIQRSCVQQRNAAVANHKTIKNSTGNDATITRAMRYSQYVNNSKPRTEYKSTAAERLAAQGITYQSYFSPILVSLRFTNLREFNMPRLKIFSNTNVR